MSRDLPPLTGSDSAREILGEYGIDGGFSDVGATAIVNPKPKKLWQFLDKLRSMGITARGVPDAQPVKPNEIELSAEITFTSALTITALDHEGHTLRFTGSSPLTQNLPAIAGIEDGFRLRFANSGTATLTLDGNGSEPIGGALTLTVPPGVSAVLEKFATGWRYFEREAIALVPGAGAVTGLVTTDANGRVTGIVSAGSSLTPLTANTTFFVRSTPVNATMSSGTPGVVNSTAHGFVEGQRVFFNNVGGSSIPAAIVSAGDGVFFVRNPTANTFNVSATVGGSLIAFATASTGTPQISSGSDSNTGAAATPSQAFATLAGALASIRARFSLGGFTASIVLQRGTHTGGEINAGMNGPGDIQISGAIALNPSDHILTAAVFRNGNGVPFTLTNLFLQGAEASGASVLGQNIMGRGTVVNIAVPVFSQATGIDFNATDGGVLTCNVLGTGSFTIQAGSRVSVMQASNGGFLRFEPPTAIPTVSSGITVSAAFANASNGGVIRVNNGAGPYGGTVTGQRHNASALGLIQTGTANANFFPGSVAGAVTLGGIFN